MGPKKKLRKSIGTSEHDVETNFQVGDLVGARIKGHPLWPGRIEAVHEPVNGKGKRKYTVRFFSSDDTSQSSIQIKLFENFTDQEKACSRRGFQEALHLCQQEYDLLSKGAAQPVVSKVEEETVGRVDEEEDDKISDYQSACSSPELKISIESIDKPEVEVKAKNKPADLLKGKPTPAKKCRLKTPKNTSRFSREDPASNKGQQPPATATTNPTTSNKQSTIADDAGDGIAADPGGAKKTADQDGENMKKHSETLRKLTLAKLQEKVKKKIKEKEARKTELRERRSHKYYAPKLVLINQKLQHISSLANRFSKVAEFGKTDLQQWNSAVRIYQTLSTPLTKCVNFFNRNNMKLSPECRDCHETLVSIVTNVKRAQNDNQVPPSIKKELKRIIKLMKNSDLIDFINDDMKNAMTERKENDAE